MLALAGARAHDMPIDGNPDRVWASSRSPDSASSCIIKALDAYRRTESSLAPSITHASKAIEPGKVYEIRPRQNFTVAAENYFVRLEKIDDRITRISLLLVAAKRPSKGLVQQPHSILMDARRAIRKSGYRFSVRSRANI